MTTPPTPPPQSRSSLTTSLLEQADTLSRASITDLHLRSVHLDPEFVDRDIKTRRALLERWRSNEEVEMEGDMLALEEDIRRAKVETDRLRLERIRKLLSTSSHTALDDPHHSSGSLSGLHLPAGASVSASNSTNELSGNNKSGAHVYAGVGLGRSGCGSLNELSRSQQSLNAGSKSSLHLNQLNRHHSASSSLSVGSMSEKALMDLADFQEERRQKRLARLQNDPTSQTSLKELLKLQNSVSEVFGTDDDSMQMGEPSLDAVYEETPFSSLRTSLHLNRGLEPPESSFADFTQQQQQKEEANNATPSTITPAPSNTGTVRLVFNESTGLLKDLYNNETPSSSSLLADSTRADLFYANTNSGSADPGFLVENHQAGQAVWDEDASGDSEKKRDLVEHLNAGGVLTQTWVRRARAKGGDGQRGVGVTVLPGGSESGGLVSLMEGSGVGLDGTSGTEDFEDSEQNRGESLDEVTQDEAEAGVDRELENMLRQQNEQAADAVVFESEETVVGFSRWSLAQQQASTENNNEEQVVLKRRLSTYEDQKAEFPERARLSTTSSLPNLETQQRTSIDDSQDSSSSKKSIGGFWRSPSRRNSDATSTSPRRSVSQGIAQVRDLFKSPDRTYQDHHHHHQQKSEGNTPTKRQFSLKDFFQKPTEEASHDTLSDRNPRFPQRNSEEDLVRDELPYAPPLQDTSCSLSQSQPLLNSGFAKGTGVGSPTLSNKKTLGPSAGVVRQGETLWRIHGTRRVYVSMVKPRLEERKWDANVVVRRDEVLLLEIPTPAALEKAQSASVGSLTCSLTKLSASLSAHPSSSSTLSESNSQVDDLLANPVDLVNVYVYVGDKVGKVLKAKALEVAHRVVERDWNRRGNYVVLEASGEGKVETEKEKEGWGIFAARFGGVGREGLVGVETEGSEGEGDGRLRLYGYDPDLKTYQMELLCDNGRQLSCKLIDSSRAFVLECKDEMVYLWNGRNSKADARKRALVFAKDLCKKNGNCPLQQERDLSETVFFMERFVDWFPTVSIQVSPQRNVQAKDRTRAVFDRGAYKDPTDKIEVALMFNPPSEPLSWDRHADPTREEPVSQYVSTSPIANTSTSLSLLLGPPPPEIDLGKLELKVWMAVGSDLVPVEENKWGVFYSEECYVILYRCMKGRLGMGNAKEARLVYFWIGDDSRLTEQGTVAYAAIEMEKQHNANQIRVAQGHEPDHFVSIFSNKLAYNPSMNPLEVDAELIRDQAYLKHYACALEPSSILIRRGARSEGFISKAVYQISGFSDTNVRATQTVWNSRVLSSGGAFVFESAEGLTVWNGSGSFDFEQKTAEIWARKIANGRAVSIIQENQEPASFWQMLGTSESEKFESVSYLTKKQATPSYSCRLFRISHVLNGNPTCQEVTSFTQRDLSENSVFILDAFFEIFLWIGSEAKTLFKDVRLGMETCLEYAEYVRSKQPERLNSAGGVEKEELLKDVWLVKSGEEPAGFKSAFPSFDDGSNDLSGSSFKRLRKSTGVPTATKVSPLLQKLQQRQYTVAELQKKDNLPLGVDPTRAEEYLRQDEFEKLFKTTLEVYASYPQWKQKELKKKGESQTVNFTHVVAFGDSYTDNGNINKIKGPVINFPFWEGRFTNGPVWVEYLASKHLSNATLLDYAVSSAVTNFETLRGSKSFTQVDREIPDLPRQFINYENDIRNRNLTNLLDPDKTLYVMFAGINDVMYRFMQKENPIPEVVSKYQLSFVQNQLLGQVKAKNVMVLNIPAMEVLPMLTDTIAQSTVDRIERSNILLQNGLANLQSQNPNIKLFYTDLHTLYRSFLFPNSLLDTYNITAGIYGVCFTGPTVNDACKNPENYMNFDALHPTTRAHEMVAEVVGSVLGFGKVVEPSNQVLVASGAGRVSPFGFWR
ncbi:hypothetical protein HDV05_003870 [Chytridiales sp. JEL 0842]|nr:hypothetical protein HDV05_003870 [Chytridiales sp. JEL 0842]